MITLGLFIMNIVLNDNNNDNTGNIEQKDDNGATPLYYAVAHGSLQCYDLLITHGAKVDVVTNEGDTLLHARFVVCLFDFGHNCYLNVGGFFLITFL